MLLKESSPRKRQGLALKLAVLLCGLALLANLNGPMDTNIGVTFSPNKEEKKVTAAAEVSPTAPKSSVMRMDWRAAAVAAPAWSVEDTTRAPFGYCARGGGFRMMSMPAVHKSNCRDVSTTAHWLIYAQVDAHGHCACPRRTGLAESHTHRWRLGRLLVRRERKGFRSSSPRVARSGPSQKSTGGSRRCRPPAPRRSSKRGWGESSL